MRRTNKNSYLIVDGYNIINAWDGLKEISKEDLESAREKLIHYIIEYAQYTGKKAIIVFDAYNVKNSKEKIEERKYITIVYTKEHQTADSYIEKEVHNVGRKYEVYVVTSDWMEQQTIFQRGAIRMSSLEFYNEVMKTEKNIRIKSEKIKNPNKNHLQDNIDNEVLKKLEDMRRSK